MSIKLLYKSYESTKVRWIALYMSKEISYLKFLKSTLQSSDSALNLENLLAIKKLTFC